MPKKKPARKKETRGRKPLPASRRRVRVHGSVLPATMKEIERRVAEGGFQTVGELLDDVFGTLRKELKEQ